ncbi:uncharacterized protein METZ01_LOCUS128353 [marine metagenome]|uniref:Uncharacterized protein n=1 Tax=marine metagenome TaxID=408172 RepID=A0A381YEK9_9ZZZZ
MVRNYAPVRPVTTTCPADHRRTCAPATLA